MLARRGMVPSGRGFVSSAALALSVLPLGVWATQESKQIVDTDPPAANRFVPVDDEAGPTVVFPALKTAGPVASATRQPVGSMTGRIVFLSAGHGWTADSAGAWYTQRGDNNELVEDFGNVDQEAMVAAYCFNAGATVVPFRPVGHQNNEVVLDNDDAGVVFSGPWTTSTATIFYGDATDTVSYRYTNSTATGGAAATARYTPTIPAAGFYPVYTWVRGGANRSNDQLYRITHSGGLSEIRINHRRVGNGWIYLGTYYFEQGTGGNVEISNQSTDTSAASLVVLADAIRFGNGMGDVNRGAGVSGKPREDECSRYWVQRGIGQGQDSTIYDRTTSTDQDDNVGTPPRMAANMNNETEGVYTDRVFLGVHTNAYDPGSIGLFNGNNDPASKTPNQERLAYLVAAECNDDLSAIGTPLLENPWPNRRTLGYSLTLDRTDIEFGEINNTAINNEFDATLIEIAAHGNLTEAQDLLDPKCRNWVARSCYQALTRYFNEFGGGPLAFLPEPPTNVRVVGNGAGGAVVSWDAPAADPVGGDPPTGYVVYRSTNGYGFGNPIAVSGVGITTTTVSGLTPGEITYFRVAATNAGGESMPSETIAVRPAPLGTPRVLIVNGFDRLNRTMNIRETSSVGIGSAGAAAQTYDRVKPRLTNSFDYVVEHGTALKSSGRFFDSCANEAVIAGEVSLLQYRAVVWILGEESTADETFSAAEQTAVGQFLDAGGSLFVSGTEIGWDLDSASGPTTADRAFYNTRLMADYMADDAGSYQATGVAGGLLGGLTLGFAPNRTEEIYDADYPDRMNPSGGSVLMANYSGTGSGGAAVEYEGGTPVRRVITMSFPFECISPATARNEVMTRAMAFLMPIQTSDVWMMY